MKNALILAAVGLAGYALWLNYTEAKRNEALLNSVPSTGAGNAPTAIAAVDHQPAAANAEIVPDVMLQKFDSRPTETTVKYFARIEPLNGIGAGCADLVTMCDGQSIVYS